jgi:N-acyl-D-aspartate/D-glutamate deacylase
MRELAAEAIRAGAFGFSTSRAYTHKTRDGRPVPTMEAGDDELVGIALALRDAGSGVLQYVGDVTIPALGEMMRHSGRPLSFTLAQANSDPEGWRAWVDRMCEAQEEGLDMRGQVCGRPVGLIFGLDLTTNPFTLHPSYKPLENLPLEEKVKRLSDPALRARLLAEQPGPGDVFNNASLTAFARMYPMAGLPDYEPEEEASVAAIARRRGVSPYEVVLDHMLANEGTGLLYAPIANFVSGNLDVSLEMMRHPFTLSGLSDGGAHVGMICDGSFPTFMLSHWTRDRTRGEKMELAEAVKMQTADTADWIGLADRGRIAVGLRADLNVIDYERLALHAPEVWHDLPAGGRRLVQRAEGYDLTMVAGTITYRNGEATGALPGRLIRAGQAIH